MDKPKYVYVASSWRCPMQEAVIAVLRAAEIPCYDFKNPEGGTGFHWSEVMPTFDSQKQIASEIEYLEGLKHPRSIEGFEADFNAMKRADTMILVLPCGRSAHLELGWAAGVSWAFRNWNAQLGPDAMDKRTAILLDGPLVTPELMYKMVDHISTNVHELLGWLGVED